MQEDVKSNSSQRVGLTTLKSKMFQTNSMIVKAIISVNKVLHFRTEQVDEV
jgi:hypothetical protein